MVFDGGFTLAEMREAIDTRTADFTVLPSGRVLARAGDFRAMLEPGELWSEYREAIARAEMRGEDHPVFRLAAIADA